jgi:hypothetical protein
MDIRKLVSLFEQDEPEQQESLEPGVYGVYEVKLKNFGHFLEVLEKVNKKAAKLGIPAFEIISKDKIKKGKDGQNTFYRIKVRGEPVKIQGWTFIATIEHMTEGKNVIRMVPECGVTPQELDRFVAASNKNCDYCHSARDRANTYVIREDATGNLKQVGGNCLGKYLGDAARKLVGASFGLYAALGDSEAKNEGGGRKQKITYDVESILAATSAMVGKYGYQKRDGGKEPTSGWLQTVMYYGGPYHGPNTPPDIVKADLEKKETINNPTSADYKKADEVIKWFKSLPEDEIKNSQFMWSVKNIVDADMVSVKSVGLIAALIPMHYRATAAPKPQQQQAAPKPTSEWVGTPGQKIPPTKVKVVYTNVIDGQWGRSQLVKFVDDKGNNYTWFNSSADDLKQDQQYTITGKIKKHDEYKGNKTTVLTHVKAA